MSEAMRISIAGDVADLREKVRSQAADLGLGGWVRLMEDGTLASHAEGERGALDEFLAAIRERREPYSGIDQGRSVVAVLEAAQRSLERGGAPESV